MTSPSNFRWSFSQWENYNGCPARWKYKSVLRLPSAPPGPAAQRGLDMHKRVEEYCRGLADHYNVDQPGSAKVADKYQTVLDDFRNHPNGERHFEIKLHFDDEWYLCGYGAPNHAMTGVLDAARGVNGVVYIGEWKSGKPKETHVDQRKLYALLAMRRWLVDEVHVTTYYLEDTAPPERLVAKSTAEMKLRELWKGRTDQMQRDQICAPKPGMHCRWCDYSKAKGGPCQF